MRRDPTPQGMNPRVLAVPPPLTSKGTVVEARSNAVTALLPRAEIGGAVQILSRQGTREGRITAFKKPYCFLAIQGSTRGIAVGDSVRNVPDTAAASEAIILYGKICDYRGHVVGKGSQTLDSRMRQKCAASNTGFCTKKFPFRPNEYRLPCTERRAITEQLYSGYSCLDFFTPIGKGQRLLITAEPGTGKSTLLRSVAAHASCELMIYVLVGERGREIAELAEHLEREPSARKWIIIASASDEPSTDKVQALETALQLAEEAASRGTDVLIAVDSLTRYARALRDIHLASGEFAARGGYPLSVFESLPRIFERLGNFRTGSITGLFTMLDTQNIERDPILEEAVSLSDGHIMLSRELAERQVYPAVDIRTSLSRLEQALITPTIRRHVAQVRSVYAKLKEQEDLVILGESEATATEVHRKIRSIESFLQTECPSTLHDSEREEILQNLICDLANPNSQ